MVPVDMDFSWKVLFVDPCASGGYWKPSFGHYIHVHTKDALWIGGLCNQETMLRCAAGDANENPFKVLHHEKNQDRLSLLTSIKVCGRKKDMLNGSRIHAKLLQTSSLHMDIYLSAALISMYAKCGAMVKAQKLFDELSVRNVICWNALISGYANVGLADEALRCLTLMQDEGLCPNVVTFISVLKACGRTGAIEKGEQLHVSISRLRVLDTDVVLGISLVDMYAKCGLLRRAQEAFTGLHLRNVITWTVLISGYVRHGLHNEALNCFAQMQDEGIMPDGVAFSCILKSCGNLGFSEKGQQIHANIVVQGLLGKDVILGTSLVDMYARCGLLSKAEEVFAELPSRDIITWNALMSGYARHGFGNEVLNTLKKMQQEGISPDAATLTCIFKACGTVGSTEEAEKVYTEIGTRKLLESDVALGNALVDMYIKCGRLEKACQVLRDLPTRDIISWKALITAYIQHGFSSEALKCFKDMRDDNIPPDAITYSCIAKACGNLGLVERGAEIHAEASKQGLLEQSIILGTALVDMYAKCGLLSKAQQVFDGLKERDVVSWTALIAGYVQHGLGLEALQCFQRMHDEGISPDAATFACILKACGNIGLSEKGKAIHYMLSSKNCLVETEHALGTALVNMYVNCGMLENGQKVFDNLLLQDTISWNAMITGYAQFGCANQVFTLFHKMIVATVMPDVVTFIALLTACIHAGMLVEGQRYIQSMSSGYGVIPTVEHYTCMVDLFSRAGCFDKAIMIIEKVPPSSRHQLWCTMLGACQESINLEIGRWAFEHAMCSDESNATVYVCMSNIYAAVGDVVTGSTADKGQ